MLEGIQCDQDYLRLVFELERGPSRQLCCHYCPAIQWISNTQHHQYNHPQYLYTVFGFEGHQEILGLNYVFFNRFVFYNWGLLQNCSLQVSAVHD